MTRKEHEKGMLDFYEKNLMGVPDEMFVYSCWKDFQTQSQRGGYEDITAEQFFSNLQLQKGLHESENIDIVEAECEDLLRKAQELERDHPMSPDELTKFRKVVSETVAKKMALPFLLNANKDKRKGSPWN